MHPLKWLLLCFVVGAGSTSAQELDEWVGAWAGTGQLMGRDAAFTLCLDRSVHDNLMRLDYRIQPANGPAFLATAYYLFTPGGTAAGKWFDSRGVVFDVALVHADSTLTVTWTGQRESGRTEYRLSEGRLEVRDFVNAGAVPREFARSIYARTEDCPL